MTTPADARLAPAAGEQSDPFRYGWRYRRTVGADGAVRFEQVPLRREDLLFPEEEDVHLTSDRHERIIDYLRNSLEATLDERPDAVVLRECNVRWRDPALCSPRPNLMVIFGVRQRRNWSTFDEAEEGTRPAIIIEVTSPSNWEDDLEAKLEHYDQAGLECYIVVDNVNPLPGGEPRLRCYRRRDGRLQPAPFDAAGRFPLPKVGLWLAPKGTGVVFSDAVGQEVPDHVATVRLRRAAERARAEAARAEAEAAARAALEARLRELEAQLRRAAPPDPPDDR